MEIQTDKKALKSPYNNTFFYYTDSRMMEVNGRTLK